MATPVKRRATSVKLRRDDSRARQVSQQTTAAFETAPLIDRRPTRYTNISRRPRLMTVLDERRFGDGPSDPELPAL